MFEEVEIDEADVRTLKEAWEILEELARKTWYQGQESESWEIENAADSIKDVLSMAGENV